MYVDHFSVQSSQRAIQARHSLHSIHAIWGQLALQRTWIIQSRSAGDVAMAYWSCDSLKVPGFVIRISFVNRIFVYSVYGQTEFPFRKPFETEFTIFPNGKGNFLKRKIITPRIVKTVFHKLEEKSMISHFFCAFVSEFQVNLPFFATNILSFDILLKCWIRIRKVVL